MRLKRLELFGFKSFADRTVLDFERDVVGIVGPNGCGKSNVVDAVRWVLGEQRASSMRGGEMADVIFKGSASRPALAVAEVTMVLDNECETLEGRGEEVAITRRVFKSGEGEYQLDGERVRLKDIKELLYGTGLGSRGYSFLEQGKIDAVLSANAIERRAIFEEAAGISRYRQRIRETTNKLKRVEADLLRLDDVLGELEKRERSLKIQAGKAQRFLEAREEWTREGLRFARHRMHTLQAEVEAAGTALGDLERQTEAQREARSAAERDVNELQTEQQEMQSEVDRLGSQAAEMAGDLRALDERVAQLGARVTAWRESATEETERATQLGVRLEARQAQLTELSELVAKVQREAEGADARAEELEGERRAAEARSDEARQLLDRQNASVLELLDKRTSWKNRVQHLGELLGPLAERLMRAESRRDEMRAAVEEAGSEAVRARESVEERQAGLTELEAGQREAQAMLAERRERASALEEERAGLELDDARLASRIESLMDREREREGLERGAQGLFQAVDDGALQLGAPLHGILADHLRIDASHARALDAALASRSQALVLQGEEDAMRALAWLREGEVGRATIVLAQGARGTEHLMRPGDGLLTREGVLGRLLDELQADEAFRALAEVLLADVVLVSDTRAGLALVAEFPSLRFVTPEGDLIDAAGVVGGFQALAHGPIGRRAHAAELEAERERLGERLAVVRAELVLEREAEAADAARLAELGRTLQERGRELVRLRAEAEAQGKRRAELERSAEVLEREQGGLASELANAQTALDQARQEDVTAAANYEREREGLERLEAERGELEQRRESLAADAQRARLEARGHADRLESLELRSGELEREANELGVELERAKRLTQERSEAAERGEAERATLGEERVVLVEGRTALDGRLNEARERERAGRERAEELRQRGDAITGELEGLLARVAEERLAHQRLELARDELARRTEEDFQIVPAALLDDFEPEVELLADDAAPLEALGKHVADCKRAMDKCGPVNLDAVEELAEVSERLGFMTSQRGDLQQARKTLEGTIEKLNEESEKRFVDTFNEVKTSFRAIFRQLFNGGTADIMLLDEENVLDSGLEIIARPPGREALPISLLSGGQRTMTALALLFAVFRAQPSPFCILDEVDAALDDANINRFLSLLEGSELSSQFLIVTHNKGTMSACDALYGVTMATRGVSKVVQVELSDVDDFVPEATGKAPAAGKGRKGGSASGADEAPPADDQSAASEENPEENPEENEVTLVPFSADGAEGAAADEASEETQTENADQVVAEGAADEALGDATKDRTEDLEAAPS